MTHEDNLSVPNLESLNALLNEAITAELSRDYQEAVRLSEQILASVDTAQAAPEVAINREVLKASATRMLGNVALRRNEYATALQYYEVALSLSNTAQDLTGVGSSLSNLGLVHYEQSDYTKALEYYSKALNIAEAEADKDSIARSLSNIGIVYRVLSDYPTALEYHSRALAIREELGDEQHVAYCLSDIGVVYGDCNEYQQALEFHVRALSIKQELGNELSIAASLGNIGNVYLNLTEYSTALEYYTKTLDIYERYGQKRSVANTLNNTGIVYRHLSNYPKALECYEKALALDEELGRRNGIARNLCCIGEAYMYMTDYPKAQAYYAQALELSEELGLESLTASIKAEYGKLYSEPTWSGRDELKSEMYLLKSIETDRMLGTKHFDTYKSLADLYELQGRWQEANTQLKNYQKLKDEVLSDEAKKHARQIEQQKQIALREKELAVAASAAEADVKATKNLLHKVLPPTVASRILGGEDEIADYFTSVSILFADIAGFTPISSGMPAFMVVRFLNYVFGEFDRIIKKHGCEKIKTIGDGYMAVAGAPIECADHAERLAAAAFEMQEVIELPEDIREYLPEGTAFGVRVGLHTGSVVAGVIGTERFVYDIYSDAVNIAARMESHGEPDKIHVTQDFVRHLQNRFAMAKNTAHGMNFVKRGEIEIKGKGMMLTYFLEKL